MGVICLLISSVYSQTNTKLLNLSIITETPVRPTTLRVDMIVEREHYFSLNFDEFKILGEKGEGNVFWYGQDGQILRAYTSDFLKGKFLKCYRYNEKGKLTESFWYDMSVYSPKLFFKTDVNEKLILRKKVRYQYNDKGQINKVIICFPNGDFEEETYQYDNNGRINKVIIRSPDGDFEEEAYKYDDNGRVNLADDMVLEYDNQNRVIEFQSVNSSDHGNKWVLKSTNGFIFYEYENNENMDWVVRKDYVIDKNKVSQKRYLRVYTREYINSQHYKGTVVMEDEKNNPDSDINGIIKKNDPDIGYNNIFKVVDGQVVDEMPSFSGDIEKWLKRVKYPMIAQEENIQGRVTVQFVIAEDGSITDVKVVTSVHPSLDNEVIRWVESMPKWNPGKHKGKAVRVSYTVSQNFILR